MEGKKFATILNCIDGRTQIPTNDWIRSEFGIDFVDTITAPGMDKLLNSSEREIEAIKNAVEISVEAHGSDKIFIAGHYDCAGNPVSNEMHAQDIRKALERVSSWNWPVEVIGLWINEDWQIEKL